MSKPEDIPQDVWDAAIRALHTDWDDPALAMSRAILAAKAEEREACIQAAISCRIDVPLSPGLPDGASIAKNSIVSAIRKREG